MSAPRKFVIRFGRPSDAPALLEYEHEYFSAVASQPHGGYVYADIELATLSLSERIASALRMFTVVAEDVDDGTIVGFAAADPSSFPGDEESDPSGMRLRYLAVDARRRREGIGRALLEEIEARSLAAHQNILTAHIHAAQEAFYRANGWDVLVDASRGLGWLPFNAALRGDIADARVGFPLMAWKVLRPCAIRTTFDFPITSGGPRFDALTALNRLVDAGRIDERELDEDTRSMAISIRRSFAGVR